MSKKKEVTKTSPFEGVESKKSIFQEQLEYTQIYLENLSGLIIRADILILGFSNLTPIKFGDIPDIKCFNYYSNKYEEFRRILSDIIYKTAGGYRSSNIENIAALFTIYQRYSGISIPPEETQSELQEGEVGYLLKQYQNLNLELKNAVEELKAAVIVIERYI